MGHESRTALSVQTWTSASALLFGVTGISKVLGFVRELLLASYFGAGREIDAYAVAYAIPLFLAGGIGYAFSTAIIPGYHSMVAEHGKQAGLHYLSTSCVSSVAWSFILLSPVWGAPEYLVKFAAPSMSAATIRLTVELMGWLSIYVLIQNCVYVLSAVFHAFNHFRLPAVSDLLFNVVVIGVLMALASNVGVHALVIGNLGGIFICLLVLMGIILRTHGAHFGALSFTGLVHPILACLPVALYYVASQFPGLLANYFASGLGEGSIAAFSYARTIVAGLISLITVSVARAAYPTFASLFTYGREEQFREFVAGLARLILYGFLPLSVLCWVYQKPLLRLLYQRGAFDEAALTLTATAFGFLAIGLTFGAWEPVGTRALYAAGDARSPLLATILSACLVVPLCLMLTPALGLAGVALSLALAFAVDSAMQVISLGWRLNSPIWKDLAWFSMKCATCALFATTSFLVMPVDHGWQATGGGVLYICSYGLLTWWLVRPVRSMWNVAIVR